MMDRDTKENKSKEAVLDHFHHMEWMKKTDSSNMARSNSRGQERKKHNNKDEQIYFEGAGTQKTKKGRKFRPVEKSEAFGQHQAAAPTGFSFKAGSSGPPPVNAWAQKKGSALFTKAQDEVDDEEDEMIKLVLKESLKTAEEDKKRHLERLKMGGFDPTTPPPPPPGQRNPSSQGRFRTAEEEHKTHLEKLRMLNKETNQSPTESNLGAEENWDDDDDDESYEEENPLEEDLHFVDTHTTHDQPIQQRKDNYVPTKVRGSLRQQDVFPGALAINKKEIFYPKPPSSHESFPQYPNKNQVDYDSFETPRPLEKFEPPVMQNKRIVSNKSVLIPEPNNTNVEDLSSTLKSTLTFGDTEGLFEKIQENNVYPLQTVSKHYPYQSQDYLNNDPNTYVTTPASNSPSFTDIDTYTDSTETDIMLHNFIRHDPPPSSITPDRDSVQSSSDMFSQINSQQYLCNEATHLEKQHPLLNGKSKSISIGSNGLGSNSSLASDSPLQNVTPYGSLENQMTTNLTGSLPAPQNAQLPLSFAMNLQGNENAINNLQDPHLNCNVPSQMAYGNLPTGYLASNHPLQSMIPMNAQLPGISQYRLPNPNMILPPIHAGSAAQIYQTQLQNLALMNTAYYQYQQAQIAALNAVESQKNPSNIVNQTQQIQPQLSQTQNQSEISGLKNQPQSVSEQNQPHVLPLQSQPPIVSPPNQSYMMSPQNQAHMIPTQNQSQLPLQNQTPMVATQNQQMVQSQNQSPNNLAHLPNQPHMLSAQEQTLLKHDIFPKEYEQQQPNMQNHGNPITPQTDKTNLHQEYIQTFQRLQQIQQAMGSSQIPPQPIQFPSPQPFVYPSHPLAVSMNSFYPGMPVIPPVTQHQQSNPVPNVDQISPTGWEHSSHAPGAMNVTQGQMEAAGHNGHGRLH